MNLTPYLPDMQFPKLCHSVLSLISISWIKYYILAWRTLRHNSETGCWVALFRPWSVRAMVFFKSIVLCCWCFCIAECLAFFHSVCLVFLQELPEYLMLKNVMSGKCPTSLAFFPIVGSDEMRGGPCVVLMTTSTSVQGLANFSSLLSSPD